MCRTVNEDVKTSHLTGHKSQVDFDLDRDCQKLGFVKPNSCELAFPLRLSLEKVHSRSLCACKKSCARLQLYRQALVFFIIILRINSKIIVRF